MAHNNKQTIEELYREYYHDIMYYLYRRTHQLETAKDLAQDTFLKAFAGLESFRGHSSIKESELEEETMIWMKEHEQFFQDQAEAAAAGNRELPGMQKTDDHQKLLHIKIFVYSLYGAFLLLSIWIIINGRSL
ncbi:hypothetical protein DT075_22905 [Bacillus licheniformis]|nr:hypothetical protein DT075_22905 [Bacillus licheniformis]